MTWHPPRRDPVAAAVLLEPGSSSKICAGRPSRRGNGWRPTWPRPTDWRAGSRPSGCGPPMPKSVRHDLLTTKSGCSNSCWARVRVAGSGLEERVGGRCWWTRTLLSSRSVLAGRHGWLCWHRGQIRRRHHGWRGRCHRRRFRHYGDRLPTAPTAAAGLAADRGPGRLELVGGLAAQLVKPGHGLLGGAFDLRPLPQPPGRLGELLVALPAGLGPQHISGDTADSHAQGSAPSPSAATRPNPPGTLPDRLAGRLDAGPRSPATLHGNPYR